MKIFQTIKATCRSDCLKILESKAQRRKEIECEMIWNLNTTEIPRFPNNILFGNKTN